MNRRFTTAGGEAREETCFVDIDVWGAQAESCATYLRKGAQALVEGRLQLDQWQDRETGQNRSRLKVTAERVQFMNLPRGADFGEPAGADSGTARADGVAADRRSNAVRADVDNNGPSMPEFTSLDTDDDNGMDAIPF